MAKKKMVSKGKAATGKKVKKTNNVKAKSVAAGAKQKPSKTATASSPTGGEKKRKVASIKSSSPAPAKTAATANAKTASRPASGKLSALDAAVRVLKERGKPMQVKPLVEAMIEKRYWASSGKTPWATLHAAICREIAKRGKEARFKKVGRGLFAIRT